MEIDESLFKADERTKHIKPKPELSYMGKSGLKADLLKIAGADTSGSGRILARLVRWLEHEDILATEKMKVVIHEAILTGLFAGALSTENSAQNVFKKHTKKATLAIQTKGDATRAAIEKNIPAFRRKSKTEAAEHIARRIGKSKATVEKYLTKTYPGESWGKSTRGK